MKRNKSRKIIGNFNKWYYLKKFRSLVDTYFFIFFILCLKIFFVIDISARDTGKTKKRLDNETSFLLEIQNLGSKDIDKKVSAINKLSQLKDKNEKRDLVIKEFSELLKKEEDTYVKLQIVESISDDINFSTVAYNSLLSTLYDSDVEVRKKSILSLSKVNNKDETIKEIEKILDVEKDKGVKLAIVSVLRSYAINNEKAVILIGEKLLKDSDMEVRIASVRALKMVPGNLSEKYLRELSKTEKDKSVLEEIRRR